MKRVSLSVVAAISLSITVAGSAAAAPMPLDTTFSGDGKVSLSGSGYEFAYGVVSDESAVVAYGGSATNWNRDSRYQLVARYLPGGRLDSNFAGDGVKKLRYTSASSVTDAEVTADGRLLIVGWTTNGLVLTKLRPNGSLDGSFGDGGVRRISVNQASAPQVEETSTGQLVVAWTKIKDWDPRTSNLVLTRLRANGSTIRSFGKDGVRTLDNWQNDQLDSMAIGSDDRIYLAAWSAGRTQPRGVVLVVSMSATDKIWTRRVNPNGRHGTAPVGIGIDDAGRAVVATTPYNAPGVGAIRVNSDGSLDDSYSGDGIAKADCNCYTNGAVLTDGGMVLVGGSVRGTKAQAARCTPSGDYDSTFAGGDAFWDLFDGHEFVQATAVDDTGRLLIGGSHGGKTGSAFVARFLVP